MSRPIVPLGALALAVAIFAAACSSEPSKENKETQTGAASKAPPAAGDARPAKIPILEGYTYYVGGPLLKKDAYGRERIAKFLGEVAQPPGRGMVIGVKREGDRLEYRVWVNGGSVGLYRGVTRDGLFWREYIETFRGEKTIVREFTVNDDAAQLMRIKTEQVDPETGETIRVSETTKKYQAPALPDLPEDSEDDDSGAEKGDSDAKPAPPAQPAPSAPASAGAAPIPVAPAGK
ncbi:MAG: hypothetical protein HY899_11970 [Deltaproteobacteria bacterium]|nr:hypothetical protein [Deltaproteobacteria bacterium]